MSAGLTAQEAAAAVGVSRATLDRRRRNPEPRSKRPCRVRERQWTQAQVRAVEAFRRRYPTWGRRRIGHLPRHPVRRDSCAISISDATVGRILAHLIALGRARPVPCFTVAARKRGRREARQVRRLRGALAAQSQVTGCRSTRSRSGCRPTAPASSSPPSTAPRDGPPPWPPATPPQPLPSGSSNTWSNRRRLRCRPSRAMAAASSWPTLSWLAPTEASTMMRPPIMDPGRLHLHRACPRRHLPGSRPAVAHHQRAAVLPPLGAVSLHVVGNLDVQGLHQHPTSALAGELVEDRGDIPLRGGFEYLEHWAVCPFSRHPTGYLLWSSGLCVGWGLPESGGSDRS